MKVACILGFFLLLSPFSMAKPGVSAETNQLALSVGASGIFDTEHNLTFVAEYRFGRDWHGIHPWIGMSWATDGAVFAGGGILYSIALAGGDWRLTAGAGPGYYERHQGTDLGSHLEFCTFGEISRNMSWGHRVMVRLMHISNGGLTERNPGNELLLLGYAMPLP
ncbi:MAG: acyloxyacyl hydrolase [Nibricoccus sp.]